MNILVANQTLSILAGSETHTLTLAQELVRLGHKVTAFSPQLGFLATKLEAMGVSCVADFPVKDEARKFSFELEEDIDYSFDVIICAHYEITKFLHARFPEVPIIATVHGILHENPETKEIWPEHPVTEFKVDQYVAVSEEVQDLLKKVYNIDSVIIRNFFDLERFSFLPLSPEKPKTFLVNSNYWAKDDPIMDPIVEAAEHYGAKLMAIGGNFKSTYEVNEVLAMADVVFGMGRSVLEGVARGRLGIVHGRWGTGGIITPERIPALRTVNFSGRNSQGKLASAQEIIDMVDGCYKADTAKEMRAIMEQDHNVKVAAQKYLEIAEQLIKKV